MDNINGIVLQGKFYEAISTVRYSCCKDCDLSEVCQEHAYDFCNDCGKIFDTYIDDANWHFRFSQELTDKINGK